MLKGCFGAGISMGLTFYTDYSLRMLICTLPFKPDGLATVREVARAYRISPGTSDQRWRTNSGWPGTVEFVRGRRGGLSAGPAGRLGSAIGDVIRRTEARHRSLAPCFPPVCAPCPIRPACGLVSALEAANDSFLRTLDGYTVGVTRKAERGNLPCCCKQHELYSRNRRTSTSRGIGHRRGHPDAVRRSGQLPLFAEKQPAVNRAVHLHVRYRRRRNATSTCPPRSRWMACLTGASLRKSRTRAGMPCGPRELLAARTGGGRCRRDPDTEPALLASRCPVRQ